jgi:hypothetical protein
MNNVPETEEATMNSQTCWGIRVLAAHPPSRFSR